MSSLCRIAIVLLGFMLGNPALVMAAEEIGEAVLIKTAVTGASGPLAVKEPVHRDERIRTSNTGLGQFLFLDGTKLAVGWGSSVVIDKFVYDDTKSVKRLTIKAAKGTFRWISGSSKSSAYEIVTPAGTIGVRGTAFDVYVGANGTTAVVLLNGRAQFCGSNGCRQLTRRCDCVVATRNGGVTEPSRVNRNIFRTLGNARALPFLSGNQRLSGGFGQAGISCGLSMASNTEGQGNRERQPSAPAAPRENPAPSPEPAAPSPAAPDPSPPGPAAPDPQASNPDPPAPDPDPPAPNPDPPDPPTAKPDHDKGKHHGHHGKGKSHDYQGKDKSRDHYGKGNDRRDGPSRRGGNRDRDRR